MPTIAAYTYRHGLGLPLIYPDNDLSYAENFMNMLGRWWSPKYQANPVIARALTSSSSWHADQSRLQHQRHARGGAVPWPIRSSPRLPRLRALRPADGRRQRRKSSKLLDVTAPRTRSRPISRRSKPASFKLMDSDTGLTRTTTRAPVSSSGPRTRCFEVTAESQARDCAGAGAHRPGRRILSSAKLYPKLDFYSGIMYPGHGFKPDIFTVLFAISAHRGLAGPVQELLEDPEQKIARSAPDLYRPRGSGIFVPVA